MSKGWIKTQKGIEWRREYYRKNRVTRIQVLKASKAKRRKENQQGVLEYLRTHTCVDCPEIDPIVLQFDHVRGKKRSSIGSMVHAPLAWTTIAKEIAKCEVRCANCHMRRTAKEWWGQIAKLT
jgi:hypothetical protein